MFPFIPYILIGAGIAAQKIQDGIRRRSYNSSTSTYKESIPTPTKTIAFVGATGAGKSSTINALVGYPACKVGAEHGTTTEAAEISYIGGYQLQDTPGLMDDTDFSFFVWEKLKRSELVIYITTGQLYRPELELVERIYNSQKRWDSVSGFSNGRKLGLYINKQDMKECSMDSSTRRREMQAIQEQVSSWIPRDKIAIGASLPVSRGVRKPARIDELKQLIQQSLKANIEYASNNFDWEVERAEAVIRKCRERVEEQYNYLKERNKIR